MNTIDLIFNNGVDWKAFGFSLQQLQIEHEESELVIQSVENKGDGITVIKVAVSPDANKQKLHATFTQHYELALQVLEEKYRSELNSKDEQIALYRQNQANLQGLARLLASQPTEPLMPQLSGGKRVLLKIGQGDFSTGFPVTLQISREGLLPFTEQIGALPPIPDLPVYYDEWQSTYRACLKARCRLEVVETQITNVSYSNFLSNCNAAAITLQQHLNDWLHSKEFRPIKEQMLAKLDPLEPIQILVQTDHPQLQRLPWCAWKLCDRYPKAEVALAQLTYDRADPVRVPPSKVRVLAILGNSSGIDVQRDRQYLEQLSNAEVTFLVEPQRQLLNDQLWSQPWDVLFFAGHSSSPSNETGLISINTSERLSLSQLRYGLQEAVRNGLKLAIFNSCDGLGLANELAELNLSQMIVMREPVPDQVAHVFLRSFLKVLSSEVPFYQAVRVAREQLQGLENQFPCATWLPVIFQNPAASFELMDRTQN